MMSSDPKFNPGKHKLAARKEQAEELARMDKIVENSSEKNRNFFIAYLGLLIYVQAIIFSTTDLQLLVSTEGLKLPLIDLNVPLVGFYVVVPIFVIALHFNFLQNLESHHYKLMQWQVLHPGGTVPRKYIYPFLFDYAILEKNGQFHRLVQIANSLLCYNLAPITLGLLLIRFSDRQEWLTTLWHYSTFVFDSWLVWRFKVAIRHNAGQGKVGDQAISNRFIFYTKKILRMFVGGLFGLFILAETLLTLAIGATPDSYFVKHIQPKVQPLTFINPLRGETYEERVGWRSVIEKAISNPIEWLLPRIMVKPDETVWQPDVKALEISAKLAGNNDWLQYFNKNRVGFQPALSSLRFASLRGQNLPGAELYGAKLQGADLSGAKLQGANLADAQLQYAYLSGIQLQDVNLYSAEMHGANLAYAQLRGANLEGAQMKGANLYSAQLQDANLSNAQLLGIRIEKANLQGAYLHDTLLAGTYLVGVQMQGAYLYRTRMQGAYLYSSRLQGAILGGTKLQGADLVNTSIAGAILNDTAFSQTINIPDSAVWGVVPDQLFSEEKQDWQEIKNYSTDIIDGKAKEEYLERIASAENYPPDVKVHEKLHYRPADIAKQALKEICFIDPIMNIHTIEGEKERTSSAKAFRQSYLKMKDENPDLLKNRDYLMITKDIDRQLCTLSECAYLRNKIEGLNCKSYLKESPKIKY